MNNENDNWPREIDWPVFDAFMGHALQGILASGSLGDYLTARLNGETPKVDDEPRCKFLCQEAMGIACEMMLVRARFKEQSESFHRQRQARREDMREDMEPFYRELNSEQQVFTLDEHLDQLGEAEDEEYVKEWAARLELPWKYVERLIECARKHGMLAHPDQQEEE